MKKLLTKSILIMAALLMGSSAWADPATLYERGNGTDWTTADATEWVSGAEYAETQVTTSFDGSFVMKSVANARIDYNFTKTFDTAPANNSTIVLTATWTPTCYGNNNYAFIEFGDIMLKANRSQWTSSIVVNNATTALTANNNESLTGAWSISLTINQQLGNVAYSITHAKGTDSGTLSISGAADYSKVKVGVVGSKTNWGYDYAQTLAAIKVTEEAATKSAANYTVNYLCGAEIIKKAVVRSGYVDDTIELLASDKEAFLSEDGNTKYTYESDNSSEVTIASDGSAVVNINFTSATKFTYTVKAFDESNNELATLISKSEFSGNTIALNWSKYIKVGEQWYVTDETTFRGTATEAKETRVKYKESDIAYFIECESMGGVRTDNRRVSTTNDSYSGYERIRQNSYYRTITTAALEEGGIYDMDLRYGNDNASTSTSTIQVISGGVTTNVTDWTCKASTTNDVYKLKGIVIPAGGQLAIYYAGDGNANARMDYLTLTKVTDVTASIGDAGYATFASSYALDLDDLPSGLTAYYVASDGVGAETVTLTPATGTVEAGTGLILAGAKGSYSIPVVASGSELSGNLLVGVPAGEALAVDANKYVLANNGGTAEFQSLAENGATLAAGKAYLQVESGGGANLRVVFGDEATAINAINSAKVESDILYNVAGQRVNDSYKGIVIKNGKKYLNK